MDKKNITAVIMIIGLGALFTIACTGLFLTKGKSKFWTSKKMRIGAAILTLTAVAQSCEPIRTCYEPAQPENMMYLNPQPDTVDLDNANELHGYIDNRISAGFSYKIQNSDVSQVYQTDDILSVDSALDEYSEEFVIQLDTALISGNYNLKLYAVKKEDQTETTNPQNEYYLTIVNNK
jgi:hypothetical protein